MNEKPTLLSTLDEITPEWLSAVLAWGGRPRAVVETFTGESIGTGQVGENIRLSLKYASADPGAPASLVVKLPSANEVSRATAVAQGIYAREVRFYAEAAGTVGIRTPRCWHADVCDDGSRFVLVFEDMAPAVQGDQLRGCTVDEAALALSQAAQLHAPRWNDPGLDSLEWLSRPSSDSAALLQAVYQGVLPGFEARFAERLPGEVMDLARRFGQSVGAWSADRAGPRALVHGDFRLDNMLFGQAEASAPLAVVDWQTCAHGHPASDVAYFLGAGLLPDLRRREEKGLLAHYHAELRALGVDDYALETLEADYRRFSFSGLVMAVVASQIVEVSERGDAMFAAMAERHGQQIADLDAEAGLG
ncbi:MAG: ecdysteroid 22-kinase family protein [Myxococcota bacterium]|nr:ecdysteroid 22-kinase family protein [Myxococcota bacterium]